MMSDHETTLVNDNSKALQHPNLQYMLLTAFKCMSLPKISGGWRRSKLEPLVLTETHRQEFYVVFKGPDESTLEPLQRFSDTLGLHLTYSTFQRRSLESTRRITRRISIQKPEHRLREPNLPPEHRRDVSQVDPDQIDTRQILTPSHQLWLCLPRRDQPDLVSNVRHDQHLRSLPPAITPLSKRGRPSQRRSSGDAFTRLEIIRKQSSRSVYWSPQSLCLPLFLPQFQNPT